MDLEQASRLWREQEVVSSRGDDEMVRSVTRAARAMERRVVLRDVIEITTAVAMAVGLSWVGLRAPVGWPWFGAAALSLGVGAFLVGDRRLQRMRESSAECTVSEGVSLSLQRVEHQIWLLRNVTWWYLAPLGLAASLIVVGTLLAASEELAVAPPGVGWLLLLAGVLGVAIPTIVFWGIYRLNQRAVERHLVPQRDALRQALDELRSES